MGQFLAESEFQTWLISKFLRAHAIRPQCVLEIQKTCNAFALPEWDTMLGQVGSQLQQPKFLYLFVKGNATTVHSLYLGKSTQDKIRRLQQHLEGLKEVHAQSTSENPFYIRFYSQLFRSDPAYGLYLVIIPWKGTQEILNIFSFPLPVNLDNAESILIARLAHEFPKATLNHEFISRTRWESLNLQIPQSNQISALNIGGATPVEFWQNWIHRWYLAPGLEPVPDSGSIQHVPLFKTEDNGRTVVTQSVGSNRILVRHPAMEARVTAAVGVVEQSYEAYCARKSPQKVPFSDGLVYMVYILRRDLERYLSGANSTLHARILAECPPDLDIIPIYIGKTEMLGRNGTFSRNLQNITGGGNRNYFARWGNDSARHIGGLSYQFFRIVNAYPSTDYEAWIQILFDPANRIAGIPQLRFPVYFQMKPWYPYLIHFANMIGLFSPDIESLLIALCRNIFPTSLGNKHNR
jgi:hypothetical protein